MSSCFGMLIAAEKILLFTENYQKKGSGSLSRFLFKEIYLLKTSISLLFALFLT